MRYAVWENFDEKKVANICDSDWEEASEGRRGEGLRSRRLLMEFQSLRGFEEEEAIRKAWKRFLAAIIVEWYLFEVKPKVLQVTAGRFEGR